MKHNIKIFYLIFLFLFGWAGTYAQNLVPNSSFEDTIGCPQGGATFFAKKWIINVNSADYFHSCVSIPNNLSVPQNGCGYQYAADGIAYFGLFPFVRSLSGCDVREYFGCKLISSLVIGQKYYASFKVSLANNMPCAINNLGMLFTNVFYGGDTIFYNNDTIYNENDITPPIPLIRNYAHINSIQKITDTTNWVSITGSFIADSNYQYVLIGNFFNYNVTDTILYSGNTCRTYYYIDDICVSTDSLTCNSTTGILKINKLNSSINIFPNPSNNSFTIQIPPHTNYIEILNSLGQVIDKRTVVNNTELNFRINDNGIYFIKIYAVKDIITKKIIIIN